MQQDYDVAITASCAEDFYPGISNRLGYLASNLLTWLSKSQDLLSLKFKTLYKKNRSRSESLELWQVRSCCTLAWEVKT